MNKATNARTLLVVLTLIPVVMVNTIFAGVLDVYNEWWAWTVTAVAVAVIALALRFPARLTGFQTSVLLLLPFAVAALGAWL